MSREWLVGGMYFLGKKMIRVLALMVNMQNIFFPFVSLRYYYVLWYDLHSRRLKGQAITTHTKHARTYMPR